jgi:hypothetical protein
MHSSSILNLGTAIRNFCTLTPEPLHSTLGQVHQPISLINLNITHLQHSQLFKHQLSQTFPIKIPSIPVMFTCPAYRSLLHSTVLPILGYLYKPQAIQNSPHILHPLCKVRQKGKDIPVTGPSGCDRLRLPQYLDKRLLNGGKVVSPTRRPHFTPRFLYF